MLLSMSMNGSIVRNLVGIKLTSLRMSVTRSLDHRDLPLALTKLQTCSLILNILLCLDATVLNTGAYSRLVYCREHIINKRIELSILRILHIAHLQSEMNFNNLRCLKKYLTDRLRPRWIQLG